MGGGGNVPGVIRFAIPEIYCTHQRIVDALPHPTRVDEKVRYGCPTSIVWIHYHRLSPGPSRSGYGRPNGKTLRYSSGVEAHILNTFRRFQASVARKLSRARFGEDWSDRLKLLGPLVWHHRPRRPVTVAVRVSGGPLLLELRNRSDFGAFDEVFVLREYAVELAEPPLVILDLGAYVGMASLYFALRYPQAQIYAVEASPSNYKQLVKNTSSQPRIHPVHLAVSDEDGVCDFFPAPNSPASSSLTRRSAGQRPQRVPCRSYRSLCRELGLEAVDLLKLDVEGAEERLFSDMDGLRHTRHIVGEMHYDLTSLSREDCMEHLTAWDCRFRPLSPQRDLLFAVRTPAPHLDTPGD